MNASCYHQPIGNHWKLKCGINAIYSIALRSCVDQATGEVLLNATNNAAFGSFELVAELSIAINLVGWGFYQVCTVKPVKKGNH